MKPYKNRSNARAVLWIETWVNVLVGEYLKKNRLLVVKYRGDGGVKASMVAFQAIGS